MDATPPRTHPAPVHSLCLSLSRLRRHRRHRHCRWELHELLALSPSCRVTSPSIFESASSSAIFSTSWLPEISPRWAAFPRISVVGFTAITTPTPANLTAAPSLPPFFWLSHVRACLGHHRGPCHTILPLVTPSSENTAAVPPRSPPTTTPHVSRLTGAVRVKPFYLGSSTLPHWCLSHPSSKLYQSEMAGVSWDSSVMLPCPTAIPFRCFHPWTTYLYQRGMTQGARWCPWIHQRSSPLVSIRRRVCSLVSCVADTRVPLLVTQRLPPLFYSKSRFLAILQKSYL